jgi:hypothetical protein
MTRELDALHAGEPMRDSLEPTTAPEQQGEPADWRHLKRFGYAPGNYMGKCHRCGTVWDFQDKRATTCRKCAEEMHAEAAARELSTQPVLTRSQKMAAAGFKADMRRGRPWAGLPSDDDEPFFDALATPPSGIPQDGVQSGWISVDDRLPEPDSGEVLVWLTGGRCAFDEWHTHHEDPTGMSTTHTLDMGQMWRDYEFEDITHWMPLPSPPHAGEKS